MARLTTTTESTNAGAAAAAQQSAVLVTHVESPVLFYCRLLAEHEEAFGRLQAKIDAQIETGGSAHQPMPNIHGGRNLVVLVYSTIRDRWCRGRLLSYQANSVDGTPINAKVCLIDFGSVEIVLWNGKYVRPSTGEIDAFNDGAGFCFPCSLGNIKPAEDGSGKPAMEGSYLQWSSYANFLIEKETKNRTFLLLTLETPSNTNQRPNVLTCDLLPLSELELLDELNSENVFNFSHSQHYQQSNFSSLSAYLVEANVARYVGGKKRHLENSEAQESGGSEDGDDEKENIFIAAHC